MEHVSLKNENKAEINKVIIITAIKEASVRIEAYAAS